MYGENKMSAKITEIGIYRNNIKNMQQYLHLPIPHIQLYPII